MSRRRQPSSPPSLTSLLDVLFILVFASLVHAAASRGAAEEPPAPTPPAPRPAPPAVVPPAAYQALREQALDDLTDALAGRRAVIARVHRDGVLAALELPDRTIALGVPLLEHVPDPDVAVRYVGGDAPDLRLCRIVALRLQVPDLAAYLVIVTTDAPLADLPVALVDGLRRDVDRCAADQRGVAIVVDPAALPPPSSPKPTTP